MKKPLLPFLAAAIVLLMASCDIDDPMIYDFATASMFVHITDDAGTNLLDTTLAGNLFEKGMGTLTISTTRDARTEPIRTLAEYQQSTITRAYVGPWAGAVLCNDEKDGPFLFIGEFSEGANGELTLTFADGTTVSVSYFHEANLIHRLNTKAKVTDQPKGMHVSADFSTYHSVDYLWQQEK